MMARYVDRLLESLDQNLENLQDFQPYTFFLGGGTPSILPPPLLDRLLEGIRARFPWTHEGTSEANPESMTREFLDILRSHSVNRISMGVQSYDKTLLEWLGRPSGRDAILQADELLSSHWNGRISRDLLAALPAIYKDRLPEDVDLALRHDPGHLSVYELTIEQDTPLAKNPSHLAQIPNREDQYEEWANLKEQLSRRGYHRYEISNFARIGEESLHNIVYWEMKSYLGIGPGASSTIPSADGQAIRLQESKDVIRWLSSDDGRSTRETLSSEELAMEFLLMGLRTFRGLDRHRFRRIFGFDVLDLSPKSIGNHIENTLLNLNDQALSPTERGMDLLNSIIVDIVANWTTDQLKGRYHWP